MAIILNANPPRIQQETKDNGAYRYTERAILGNRKERVSKSALIVHVENEDNLLGIPNSASACAITLAVKRTHKQAVATITGYKILKVIYGSSNNGVFERYRVPESLSKQLKEFDDPNHPRKALDEKTYSLAPAPPPDGRKNPKGKGGGTPVRRKMSVAHHDRRRSIFGE